MTRRGLVVRCGARHDDSLYYAVPYIGSRPPQGSSTPIEKMCNADVTRRPRETVQQALGAVSYSSVQYSAVQNSSVL